jgi:hypothetical protein
MLNNANVIKHSRVKIRLNLAYLKIALWFEFAYEFSNVFTPAIFTKLKRFQIASNKLNFTPTTPFNDWAYKT